MTVFKVRNQAPSENNRFEVEEARLWPWSMIQAVHDTTRDLALLTGRVAIPVMGEPEPGQLTDHPRVEALYGWRPTADGLVDLPHYVQISEDEWKNDWQGAWESVRYRLEADWCRHRPNTFPCALLTPCAACHRRIPCCQVAPPRLWFAAGNETLVYQRGDEYRVTSVYDDVSRAVLRVYRLEVLTHEAERSATGHYRKDDDGEWSNDGDWLDVRLDEWLQKGQEIQDANKTAVDDLSSRVRYEWRCGTCQPRRSWRR